MQTKNILITGMQGSGKSYLAKKWAEMDLKTVDADSIPDLYAWFDESGNIVPFDEKCDEAWYKSHKMLWDEKFLRQYLKENGPIIVSGASRNTMELLPCFDRAYYLKVPVDVIEQRLQASDRENAFGISAEQRKVVLDKVAESDASMSNFDIEILDGTLSPEELLKKIDY